MYHRRWLIVAICFCIFTGCVACQSNYDYCGPMPEQGGDFMYRKNSVLGGDPSITPIDQQPEETDKGEEEEGPEPTPAPPPDEIPRPSLDLDDDSAVPDNEMTPTDEEADANASPQASYDADEEEPEGESKTASTLQWHAPTKQQPSAVRQVQFRSE